MSNRKHLSKTDKETLVLMYGSKCRSCGSERNIEWHHIVPLALGGEDTFENMVPLCYECHKAITTNTPRSVVWTRQHHKGGRKPKIPYNYKDVLTLYVNCVIGKEKCRQLLGLNASNHLTDNQWYRDYLDENGIAKIRNNIDLRRGQGRLTDGCVIGKITYYDGTEKTLYYNQAEDEAVQTHPAPAPEQDTQVETLMRQLQDKEKEIEALKNELWWERYKSKNSFAS